MTAALFPVGFVRMRSYLTIGWAATEMMRQEICKSTWAMGMTRRLVGLPVRIIRISLCRELIKSVDVIRASEIQLSPIQGSSTPTATSTAAAST